MDASLFFECGFYIIATNFETEELMRKLVDESFISKHIYDALRNKGTHLESGKIHEMVTSLIEDPRDDFFDTDETKTLFPNVEEVKKAVYQICEDEIVLYYLNKKCITTKQQIVLKSYFNIMSCYPDTEYDLALLMEESAMNYADIIVDSINDFTIKYLAPYINKCIKDRLGYKVSKPAYDCYDDGF